jgi:hypothetical protein
LKNVKGIFILIIPYFTICGALYHIAFWNTYNINGLSFISITDIIKSSVYPIFTILLTVIYNLTVQNLILPSNSDNNIKPLLRKGISNKKLLIFYLGSNLLIALILYFTKDKSPFDRNIWFGFVNAIVPSIYLINNGFLTGFFSSEKIRKYIIDLIVFIPVVSYYTGKYESEVIYQNLKYKYCVNVKIDTSNKLSTTNDTIKFIGNMEKYFVFSDFKNSRIIFIKSDKIDTLILYDKK